jgi:hypothetical protein
LLGRENARATCLLLCAYAVVEMCADNTVAFRNGN